MSLNLHSTFPELDHYMRAIDGDGNVGAAEFKWLRDAADENLGELAALDAGVFQAAADALVESMQKLAIAARKAKLSPVERTRLEEGVEHQLAYVIAGYQSSIQRL
jgi:hypothetical protein